MAERRKTIAMNASDFVRAMRDAVSPGIATEPETRRALDQADEAEPESEDLGALSRERKLGLSAA